PPQVICRLQRSSRRRGARAPMRFTQATDSCRKTPPLRAPVLPPASRWAAPRADVIAKMGAKIEARRLVAAAGVPVVPGETPADQTDAGVQQAVDRVGLPALIKASAGGGGKGMRHVRERTEVLDGIQAARREATAAFGDGTLYI